MDKKPGGSNSSGGKLIDYEILTKLGQGSFGVVYKVKRKSMFYISLFHCKLLNQSLFYS